MGPFFSDAYDVHTRDDVRPREHSVCCFLRLWRSCRFQLSRPCRVQTSTFFAFAQIFTTLASVPCTTFYVFCVRTSLSALCTAFGARALNVPVPASLGARHCLQTLSGGGHASTASRSSQTTKMLRILVEVRGFEPLTPCLQGRCSPN